MSCLLPSGLLKEGLDKYNEPYPGCSDRAGHGPQNALRQLVNSSLIIEMLQARDPDFFKKYPPELINFASMMCSIGRVSEQGFHPKHLSYPKAHNELTGQGGLKKGSSQKETETTRGLSKKEVVKKNDDLKRIIEICNKNHASQAYYGAAALNVHILQDPTISDLLIQDGVLEDIVAHPEKHELIGGSRSSTPKVTLYSVLKYGLDEDILFDPANRIGMSPRLYYEGKQNQINLGKIIERIKKISGQDIIKEDFKLRTEVKKDRESIKVTSASLNNLAIAIGLHQDKDRLLQVPGYTPQNIKDQTLSGFTKAKSLLVLPPKDLESFCEGFLTTETALLDDWVIHGFYDRAHMLGGLVLGEAFEIGGKNYSYYQIFDKLLEKLARDDRMYPDAAYEQILTRIDKLTILKSNLWDEYVVKYNLDTLPLRIDIFEELVKSQNLTPEILEKYKEALRILCDPNSQKHHDSDVKKIALIIELSHRIDHERIACSLAKVYVPKNIRDLLSEEKGILGLFTGEETEETELLRMELTKLADSRRQKLSAECKQSVEHFNKRRITLDEAENFVVMQSPENFLSQGPKNKTLPDRHLEIIFEKLLTEPDNIKYSTGDGGKIYYEIVNGDIKGDKYCLTDILEAGASVSNVQLSKEAVAKLKQQIIAETTMPPDLQAAMDAKNLENSFSRNIELKNIMDARSILEKAKEEFIAKGMLTNSKEGIAFESVIIRELLSAIDIEDCDYLRQYVSGEMPANAGALWPGRLNNNAKVLQSMIKDLSRLGKIDANLGQISLGVLDELLKITIKFSVIKSNNRRLLVPGSGSEFHKELSDLRESESFQGVRPLLSQLLEITKSRRPEYYKELFNAIKAEYNQIKLRALFSRASKIDHSDVSGKESIQSELQILLESFEHDPDLSYGKEYLKMQRDNLDKVFIKSAERMTEASIVSKTLVPDMLQKALGRAKSKIDGEDAPDLPELPVAIAPEAPVAPGPDVDDWTLTPEGVRAIRSYTTIIGYYQSINSLLRSKVSEAKSEEDIKKDLFFNWAISLGIGELRKDRPSPSGVNEVFRGEKKNLGRGPLWKSEATLSTSRSRYIAEGFSGINKIVYTICPAGGVKVHALT